MICLTMQIRDDERKEGIGQRANEDIKAGLNLKLRYIHNESV